MNELQFNTPANQLTLLRIVLVPAVIGFLAQESFSGNLMAAVLFSVAGITDYVDGYIARKYQIETVYGKLLDPLADKFLVICSLIMIQHMGRIHPYIVMLLVCRELAITGLRALASAEGVVMGASSGGKWKTATQMIAIPFLMLGDLWNLPLLRFGQILTLISLLLSWHSAKNYAVDFFRGLKISRQRRNTKETQEPPGEH